jgi:hypothetical protein
MLAIYFLYYNFCRVHQTWRVTPAIEAGISDHVWTIEKMVKLLMGDRFFAACFKLHRNQFGTALYTDFYLGNVEKAVLNGRLPGGDSLYIRRLEVYVLSSRSRRK